MKVKKKKPEGNSCYSTWNRSIIKTFVSEQVDKKINAKQILDIMKSWSKKEFIHEEYFICRNS